jgi:hypothetical protein
MNICNMKVGYLELYAICGCYGVSITVYRYGKPRPNIDPFQGKTTITWKENFENGLRGLQEDTLHVLHLK